MPGAIAGGDFGAAPSGDSCNDLACWSASATCDPVPRPALGASRAQAWPSSNLCMIKNSIDRLLGRRVGAPSPPPVGASGWRFRRQARHRPAACSTTTRCAWCRTLKDAGRQAYIVGGAVRDLRLACAPRTSTSPPTPRRTGEHCSAFIIGRRFRIVHVMFGRSRSTRPSGLDLPAPTWTAACGERLAGNEDLRARSPVHVVDASGRVLRDCVWGPQIGGRRRGATSASTLCYDPDQTVVDYHHGRDAKKRVLRMIGDPATRYREPGAHPARGALRRQAGLRRRPETRADPEMAALLANVPVSRLFDRDDQAAADRPCAEEPGQLPPSLDRGVFPIPGRAAPARRSATRPQRFVQLALIRYRPARGRRLRWPQPCSPACCWHGARTLAARRRPASHRSRRCSRRWMRSSMRA